ncbi:hypothetical protein ACFQWB_12685 [Paenibacillus thermoaerophilus]|uniref:Uncharacterized protein n=1 Tax=Paenibacillus thermoaerophilus TaxID=1215385 RepID=A0ABW2V6A7_9BACL|nr:hypothetical protein [Paenibacillus thermoaerophilus]TMV17154.1 hypothetical protein FE781_08235 [Paenibacillus thermoaerophilus]
MFYLIYKGRPYGEPMTKAQAEEKLERLRLTMDGLSIAELSEYGLLKQIRAGRSQPRRAPASGSKRAADAAVQRSREDNHAGEIGDGAY